MHNRTPQGTLLGPMFWLWYVDSLSVECDITNCADNLTLTAKPAKNINKPPDTQTSVDHVSSWCDEHNMFTNAEVLCYASTQQKTSCRIPPTNTRSEWRERPTLNQHSLPRSDNRRTHVHWSHVGVIVSDHRHIPYWIWNGLEYPKIHSKDSSSHAFDLAWPTHCSIVYYGHRWQ